MRVKTTVSLDNYFYSEVSDAQFDEMKLSFKKQDQQEYFVSELSGSIYFHGEKYDYINGKPFDNKFLVRVISTWEYKPSDPNPINRIFFGYFTKADCEFDYDKKEIKVKPHGINPEDKINALKNKKFDLFSDLTPVDVYIEKGAILQLYTANSSKVTSVTQDGQIYEQEVTPEPSSGTLSSRERFYQLKEVEYVEFNSKVYLGEGDEFINQDDPLNLLYIRIVNNIVGWYNTGGLIYNIGTDVAYADDKDFKTIGSPSPGVAIFYRQRVRARFLVRTGTFNNLNVYIHFCYSSAWKEIVLWACHT